MREQPAVGRRDGRGAAEEAGDGGGHLGQPAAVEHDPHEHPVHLVLAGEEGALVLDELGSPAASVGGPPGPRLARSVRHPGHRWQL